MTPRISVINVIISLQPTEFLKSVQIRKLILHLIPWNIVMENILKMEPKITRLVVWFVPPLKATFYGIIKDPLVLNYCFLLPPDLDWPKPRGESSFKWMEFNVMRDS